MQNEIRLGAKEWIALPELDLVLRAKIDTGAKTSSLHALNQHTFWHQQQLWVEFKTQLAPSAPQVQLCLPVIQQRRIRSSNGQVQTRLVIQTLMQVGSWLQKIELTLADRSRMKYSMLLGRSAMPAPIIVEPSRHYLQSTPATCVASLL